MSALSRLLIFGGLILAGFGLLFYFFDKLPFLKDLPGNICIQKKNFIFYCPLTTCIILSLIISLVIFFFSRR